MGGETRSNSDPKDFHHPFVPYDIQQEFMTAVYDAIEQGHVAILESPTGTGKSLSLICGALTWLRDHKRKTFTENLEAIRIDNDEPAWMADHARAARRAELSRMRLDFEARLEAVRLKEMNVHERARASESRITKKPRHRSEDGSSGPDVGDEAFLLDEYESEDEHPRTHAHGYSAETTKLLETVGMLVGQSDEDGLQDAIVEPVKVIFCSRTHSQLSQFVGELQRVRLPASLPPEPDDDGDTEAIRHLSLGSRKNLCINKDVRRLVNQTAINERCIELQQSKTPAERKCPYLPKPTESARTLQFRDQALARLMDIEDLAQVGIKLQTCPYYASRSAVPASEVITLPYPLLLQKAAREAVGVDVRNSVVIVDEAHNLISAIEGIHSTQITHDQLSAARDSLIVYLRKFRNKLKGSNRSYVTQVVRVIDSLLTYTGHLLASHAREGLVETGHLLNGKGVDQINLYKLIRYLTDSKLARKVQSYHSYISTEQRNIERTMPASLAPAENTPVLTLVQNFLATLENPSREGQFFWAKEGKSIALKYLLLDPSEHFREVVEQSRAVILAGGTMSPIEDYKQQLFPYLPLLSSLSCGHLIPAQSLLVRTVESDELGPLEFTYKSRQESRMAARVGRALLAVAPKIRGGFVVFFPSYGYLEEVQEAWATSGMARQLNAVKPTFIDSRQGSAEQTFQAYSDATRAVDRGAVLLSVIGGKLSEGINFSDDLGRCVLVIGLPFPNLETAEWKAKMRFMDDKAEQRGEVRGKASRDHAENVCMRSVNQAIGRVIRHKNDWASILLMDSRYGQTRIRDKLPGWIGSNLPMTSVSSLKDVAAEVHTFFDGKVPTQ